MADPSQRHGQVMPTWSPPYAPGPYFMEKYQAVIVELEIPREEILYMTPEPLRAADHNRVYAIIMDGSQPPHSLHYHEALICHEVEFEGRKGMHIPYIWTSTDTATFVGRELYGMPKLLCEDGWLEIHANEVFGKLEKYGRTMMEVACVIDQKGDVGEMPPLNSWIMLRHIASPDPKVPARRQVVHAQTTGFELDFLWKGRGWARMGYPGTSGIHRIPTDKVTGAWYGNFKFVLTPAEILQDIDYVFEDWAQ
ncbi:acetoacetate decarboxylase family protein [Glacieibacterium sp.]|uniref:acetoacetate decarboxylase family protein n=1 Tax=Glacieibacterium sp. TaxID=2860237 RepID=UPI003AFFC1A5